MPPRTTNQVIDEATKAAQTASNVAGVAGGSFSPQTITSEQLQPTAPLTVPPPTPTPEPTTPDLSGFIADIQKATAPDPTLEASRTAQESLLGSFASMGGKVADRAQAQQDTGFIEKQNALNTLAREGQMLQAESDTLEERLQKEARSRGDIVTAGGLAPLRTDQQRDLGIRQRFWAAKYLAAQGDFASAKEQVQNAVDDKYADREAKISNAKTQLEFINQKIAEGTIQRTKTLELALAERARLLTKQEEDVKNAKTDQTTIWSWALAAKQNGASDYVVSQIQNAKDLKSAMALYSPYSVDPMATAKAVLELEEKRKSIDKMDAEIKKIKNESNQTALSELGAEGLIAYAQQYAVTGLIPPGLPKGTFGIVASTAKELPKANGTVVNKITGTKDAKIPATIQDDFARMTNIVKNTKRLKELDEERIGGVIAGTTGKIFGSEAQSEYLAVRKSIVDDLARLQSGAALTVDEVAFYQDYLPGRLSETFGLGQDSFEKIENFEKIMNDRLTTGLDSNNLSVYGYSKVKMPDGKNYTVGEIITNAEGKSGRINADGSITIID